MYARLNQMLLDNIFAADGRPIGQILNTAISADVSATRLVLEAAVRSGRNKNDVIEEITFVLGSFLETLFNSSPIQFQ